MNLRLAVIANMRVLGAFVREPSKARSSVPGADATLVTQVGVLIVLEWDHDSESPMFREHGESEVAYLDRVRQLLPHVPPELILHWLYRHNYQAVREWSWLDIGSFRFRKEQWPLDRLVDLPRLGRSNSGIENEYQKCIESAEYRRTYPVLKYINEHGTWPVGPLIIDNTQSLTWPDGSPMHRYQVIDGMHRLGAIRALRSGVFDRQPQSVHAVWLATRS